MVCEFLGPVGQVHPDLRQLEHGGAGARSLPCLLRPAGTLALYCDMPLACSWVARHGLVFQTCSRSNRQADCSRAGH
jgi:hypothetical protein